MCKWEIDFQIYPQVRKLEFLKALKEFLSTLEINVNLD